MKKENKSIISEKDVLILQKLLEDGRQSSSSISKEINLGREIVNYRIKRLIKENLIIKFVPKLNKENFHYQEYVIFLKLNLEDEISKENFINEKIGNKYLIWTIKSDKGWDFIIRLYSENFEEFKKKLKEILEEFSEVLANYYTIISSEEIKESEKSIISKKLFNSTIKKDFKIIKNNENFQADEKDKKILELLNQNARGQYSEISEKLDISSDTVKYRIDKMKEAGLIENIEPIINLNKLGFKTYAIILKFKFLNEKEEMEIFTFLKKLDCISKAIKSISSDEYFLNSVFLEKEGIKKFEKKIKKQFNKKLENIEIFKIK